MPRLRTVLALSALLPALSPAASPNADHLRLGEDARATISASAHDYVPLQPAASGAGDVVFFIDRNERRLYACRHQADRSLDCRYSHLDAARPANP